MSHELELMRDVGRIVLQCEACGIIHPITLPISLFELNEIARLHEDINAKPGQGATNV